MNINAYIDGQAAKLDTLIAANDVAGVDRLFDQTQIDMDEEYISEGQWQRLYTIQDRAEAWLVAQSEQEGIVPDERSQYGHNLA